MDDKKFKAKAVLSLLNTTKVLANDSAYLFEITEEEEENGFAIVVLFRGQKLLKSAVSYGKYTPHDAVGIVRNKILRRIVEHFCGK